MGFAYQFAKFAKTRVHVSKTTSFVDANIFLNSHLSSIIF